MTNAEKRKEARQIIKQFKDKTAYFDRSISFDDMQDMLRYRMRFGVAETQVILAALTLAGAEFKE